MLSSLLWRAEEDDAAIGDDDDAIARSQVVGVVSGQHDRGAVVGEATQGADQRRGRGWVETRRRFVEEEGPRARQQLDADADPLALAPAEISDACGSPIGEVQFVQCLANPNYLNYLAQGQFFASPEFLAYLEYLEYFRQPEYTKLLTYPSYSLNALSLLKQPAFRIAIMSPLFAKTMVEDGIAGLTASVVEERTRVAEGGGVGASAVNGGEVAGENGEDSNRVDGDGNGNARV